MKAFVGHSFDPKDKDVINEIMTFLPKHGIPCEDAEIAENKDISDKVKKKIDANEIFVGIFTIEQEIKQLNTVQGKLKKSLLEKLGMKKSVRNLPQNDIPIFTTSNWIIQESGYAIGKSKETILLVERGIHKFPELQGDQEIIPFDRNSLSPALLKLLEIIQAIKSGMKPSEQSVSEPSLEAKNENEKKDDTEGQEGEDVEYFIEMFNARREGDIKKAEEIYQTKIRENRSEKDKIYWDASILRWKYCAGNTEALKELEKMFEKNKNYDIEEQIAYCFLFCKKYDIARARFKECIPLSRGNSEKTNCFVQIAKTYSEDNDYNSAFITLLDIVNNPEFKENLEIIFKALIEIAEKKKDDYLYFIFSEKILDINPINTKVRFSLAYKYGDLKKGDLAIYHYKELLRIQEDEMALNNIGVEYSNLDMKAKGVPYYLKAIEKKNTLAFANVAYKYLDEGFTDMAHNLLKKADELSRDDVVVHENVGYAKRKLSQILEEEGKKEEELLRLVREVLKFKVRHADAFCLKNIRINLSEISGIWITEKWGELDFKFNIATRTFKAHLQERIEKSPGFLGNLAIGAFGLSQSLPKEYKIRKVEIKGNIDNLSGKYTIKVTEEKEETTSTGLRQTLLTIPSPEEIYSADGLLIINDKQSIDILEEDSKNNRFFSHWNKK